MLDIGNSIHILGSLKLLLWWQRWAIIIINDVGVYWIDDLMFLLLQELYNLFFTTCDTKR